MDKITKIFYVLFLAGTFIEANNINKSVVDSLESLRLKAPDRAIRYGRDILNRLDGNPQLESKILNKMGEIYLDLGMSSLALTNFIDSREKSKDKKFNPWNKINIGNVYYQQRKWVEAKELYLQALDIFRRRDKELRNVVTGKSVALENLGRIGINLKNYDDALVHFKEALNVKRGSARYKAFQKSITGSRIDYPTVALGVAYSHSLLAELYSVWGLYDMSLEQLHASDSLVTATQKSTEGKLKNNKGSRLMGNNHSLRMQLYFNIKNIRGAYYESRMAASLLKDNPKYTVLHFSEKANIQFQQDSVYAALETIDDALKICQLNGLTNVELSLLSTKIEYLKHFKLEKSALSVSNTLIDKKEALASQRMTLLLENLNYKSEFYKNRSMLELTRLREKIAFVALGFILVLAGVVILNHRNKRKSANKDALINKQEKIITENALKNKERELVTLSANIVSKNDLLSSIGKDLEYYISLIESKADRKMMDPLRKNIKEKVDDSADWEQFQIQFSSAYPDFISSLIKKYSAIKSADIKLCCYLKMNMNTKEIAKVTGLSVRAIENKRYRLRKKLNLDKDLSLDTYINSIDIN